MPDLKHNVIIIIIQKRQSCIRDWHERNRKEILSQETKLRFRMQSVDTY